MLGARHRMGVMFRITIIAGQAQRPLAETLLLSTYGRSHWVGLREATCL